MAISQSHDLSTAAQLRLAIGGKPLRGCNLRGKMPHHSTMALWEQLGYIRRIGDSEYWCLTCTGYDVVKSVKG